MNLFFVEIGSPYSLDLAQKMQGQGYNISHVTTARDKSEHKKISKRLKCKVIPSFDLFHSKAIYKKYKDYFSFFGADQYEFFKDIEHDFMVLTDRTNYKSIPFRERKNLFYDLTRFWTGYLQKENIDCVYFPYTPHSCWELVLMQACKYLDIPYCYLSHTAINNRSLFRTDYKTIERVPEGHLSANTLEEVRAAIDPSLLEDFEAESIVTNVIKMENDDFHKQIGVNAETSRYQKFLNTQKSNSDANKYIQAVKKLVRNALDSIKKDNFYFAMAMDKKASPFLWSKAVKDHENKAKELKEFYEGQTQELDYSAPYIYFPFHLQPELTSQPEAGIFEEQLLALELLLAALPKGWKIYLKENPRQFDTTINTVSAIHYRECFDFERFLAFDNVVLVPQSEPTEKLISHSKITATLTGTAGWESLNLSKPCILFGHPWYSGCQSCFTVSTPDELKKALSIAEQKTEEDVRLDLLKYIHFYQDELKVSTLHSPSDVSYNSRPYEDLLQSHAQALNEFFSENTAAKTTKRAS